MLLNGSGQLPKIAVFRGGSRSPSWFLEPTRVILLKTTPYVKILKILFLKFSSQHLLTCCVQISCNLANGQYITVKSCAIYLTKKNKISPGSPAVANARIQIAPKICQGQHPTVYSECSRFQPNRFTFGEVIAERVNTA